MVAKKPAKKKKAKKKPDGPPVNPHLMGFGYSRHALDSNKWNFKKAKKDHQTLGRKIQELTGEKSVDKIRHFMGSSPHGRILGHYKDKPAAMRVLWNRFCTGGYDPIKFCEGEENVGKTIEEGKRLRALAHAIGDETGVGPRSQQSKDWGEGRGSSAKGFAQHMGLQAAGGAAMGAISGVGAVPGAVAGMGLGAAMQIRSRYKHLRKTRPYQEAIDYLQDLVDKGFPEEEAERLVTEDENNMEHANAILQGIVDEKPHDTATALHAALTGRLEGALDSYKAHLAQTMFNPGGEKDDDDDEEEDDDGPVKQDEVQTDENGTPIVPQEAEGDNEGPFEEGVQFGWKSGKGFLGGFYGRRTSKAEDEKKSKKWKAERKGPRVRHIVNGRDRGDVMAKAKSLGFKEEVEQVNELSAAVKGRYAEGAAKNLAKNAALAASIRQKTSGKRGKGKQVFYNTKNRKAEVASAELKSRNRVTGIARNAASMRNKTPRGPGKKAH